MNRRSLLAAVVLSASLGLVGGAGAAWAIYQHYGPATRIITQVPANSGGGKSEGASVGGIASAAAPSVVEVITGPVTPDRLLSGGAPKGFAVGFVASSDGLVVTSAHALAGATQLRVVLADGHVYDAVVAGADVSHGIAVLRAVGASSLPALDFAATAARPGDLAVAVTAPPFGGTAVVSGTVSSVGRSLSLTAAPGQVSSDVSDVLTVDATPDPQDDGGPLLDANAQVVGVVVSAGGDPSLSGVVALSGRDAASLVDRLSHGGSSQRPTFGVTAVLLDPATAAAAGLSHGALVRTVVAGGPADRAGVQRGDVITAVNGVDVDADHPLDPAAFGVETGQAVSLSVSRGGQQITLSLTVADGTA